MNLDSLHDNQMLQRFLESWLQKDFVVTARFPTAAQPYFLSGVRRLQALSSTKTSCRACQLLSCTIQLSQAF